MTAIPTLGAAAPALAALLLAGAPAFGPTAAGLSAPASGMPSARLPGRPSDGTLLAAGAVPVRPCVCASERRDSVRQLSVAIVLATASFNKVLTPAEVERVHEEVAEFYAFYQQHGAGKVDFRFSLVQIDRPIARRETAEVSPNRYYLSRENLEAELTARGFRGKFDEVIALHAWSNANPERALQAYGGGAVGPDGKFLGDAGFNSIPVMGRDPNTIGQVLIHEVLHNLDDMFSRSGMPDDFFNSDEMSRNMAQLLRERPGAFLPRYSDADMLAFADRERQGREGYPWALQLVYYGWMLERTPKAAWDRLRYGRMMTAGAPAVRPLYAEVFTSVANDSTYLPVLAAPGAALTADGGRLTADGRRLTADGVPLAGRSYTQADFDGSPIFSGNFFAAWVPLPGLRGADAGTARGGAGGDATGPDSVRVEIAGTVGVGRVRGVAATVIRQRVASVVADPVIVWYVDRGEGADIPARIVQDRLGGDGPPVPGARLSLTGGADLLALGQHDVTLSAAAPGWYVRPAAARFVSRRSWSVTDDGPLTVSLGSPLTINAFVREDRGRSDVTVAATVEGRRIALSPTGDGRFSATVTDELPPGLHWARLTATAPSGEAVTDSVRVYVRPAGWIRVPDVYVRGADGVVTVEAWLQSRMGVPVRGTALSLLALVGDRAVPLDWDSATARYTVSLRAPPGVDRVVVTSLVGDPQRRVVEIVPASSPRAHPAGPAGGRGVEVPPYAAAIRLERGPAIDADLADWPATTAQPVPLDARSFLLTDSAVYHGDRDLSARIRFAWDDSTLFVAGEITDDSVTVGDAWDTDRVNLVFDMKDDTSPLTYGSANPPLNEWQDDDYWVFWRNGGTTIRRFGKANADPVPGARLATRRTADGWAFEVAIPRAALPGFVPFVGQVAGLQVFVTDGDGEASASELMWAAKWPYTADGIEWRLAELARLLFVDAPLR